MNLDDTMQKILENSIHLLSGQMEERHKIREQSKNAYGLLLDAHMAATGVIASNLFRKSGVLGNTNESISGRLALVSSFVQGIDLCETSISEGLYSQAAALLKQQLETVAAFEEFSSGARKDRRTPNVKDVKFNLARWYGDLNGAAHVSDFRVMHSLFKGEPFGDAVPTSLLPIYSRDTSRTLYAMHVLLLVHFANCLRQLHVDMYNEEFEESDYIMLAGALERIKQEGFLEPKESG